MADKSFGVKDINLIGASGTPEIESPNNLNIKAVNVAISTDMSIGGELTVTDTFLKPQAVGLGTTTATGRDAGISTATGTIIYIPAVGMQVYAGSEGGWKTIADTAGGVVAVSASGGTEYSSGGYKYHVFLATSSPGFNITTLGPGAVDCLVVAGGGGGSTAGGGAGGMRVVPYTFTATGPTPITIGAGGAGGGASGGGASCNGNDSFIGPSGARLVSATYGGGGGSADDNRPGQPGGSGGGARTTGNDPGGTTVASPDGISPTVQGYPGGAAIPYDGGNGMSGGGGGAGGAGEAGDPPSASPRKAGDGGIGAVVPGWDVPSSYGTPGPTPGRYFAGGGGGGTWGNPAGAGGAGGGGAGRAPGDGWDGSNAYPGTVNTGGGGGANAYPPYGNGGTGGPGIVIIRYQT